MANSVSTKREIFALGAYLSSLSLVLLVVIYFLWPTADQLGLVSAGDDEVKMSPTEGPPETPPPAGDSEEGTSAAPPGAITSPPTVPPGEGTAASPSDTASASSGEEEEAEFVRLLAQPLPPDRRILLMVMVVGMLGSVIGAATSFTGYVGNKTFEGSWVWWYILRPLLGCMLALLLYFVAQAGFLTTPSEAIGEVSSRSDRAALENLFYVAVAIAGLAGMFSKLTSDKLESIFVALLQSDADEKRKDKMK